MTDERYSMQRMLALRRLTRAISDLLGGQLREYLSALAPTFRPASILGEYVQGSPKGTLAASHKVFQDLKSVFGAAVNSKPFSLTRELKSPIEILSSTLELSPMEYPYELKTEREVKTVVLTSSLKWVLTYSGFSPTRLRALLADPHRLDEETARFVLHYAVLHIIVSKQPSIGQMLDALRFGVSTLRWRECGELPITCVASSVPSIRPPDEVILESTEISGRDVFEEIVDVEAIQNLRDPFKERLLELIKGQGLT
jgi:hypothetical protein